MMGSPPTTSIGEQSSGRMRRWGRSWFSREKLIAVLVAIVFLGVVFFLGLRWLEWNTTFHPVRYSANDNWQLPHSATDVWLTTADNVRLHGWFFRSATPSFATVIYLHGNGGNISHLGWVGERLRDRSFDVLIFDYRGYGRSEGASTDERSVYADADAAYDYVVHTLVVSPERVVLYGQSMGTTAVVDLASRNRCGAIILESGLSSASDMAADILPWLPRALHLLTRNRFDSARKLVNVRCPVLVTHGDPDPVIPTEQGRKLFAAANEPKKLIIFPGAGHNVFGSQGDAYLNLITDFVKKSLNKQT